MTVQELLKERIRGKGGRQIKKWVLGVRQATTRQGESPGIEYDPPGVPASAEGSHEMGGFK